MSGPASHVFRRTLGRAEGLLALHPELHGIQGRPRQYVSDILRGTLVLASAALDALVLDSILEAVPALAGAGGLGEHITKWVREEPQRVVEAFASKNPHQVLVDLGRDKLGQQTFQRSQAIEGALRGTIGCESPWQRAAEALSTDDESWTEEDVKFALDEYVERRNRIVHGGDMKSGKTSTAPIQLRYVRRALRVIRAVGDAVTAVVSERLKSI